MNKNSAVELACAATAIIGEGPLWKVDEQRLYWLDLDGAAIYRFDPATGRNERVAAPLDGYIGGMVERASGGFVVMDHRGAHAFDPGTGSFSRLPGLKTTADTVFNDGKCDRLGQLWTGTKHKEETNPAGALFRVRKDGIDTIDTGIICSNGPAFSPCGRYAYFADSSAWQVYRYAIDTKSNAVGPREKFIDCPRDGGEPDGMTVDADGCLWVAHWGGWCVRQYTPAGRLEREIRVPVPQPTAPGFGGPAMKTMFVTSARRGLSEAQLREAPLSGSLFAIDTGTSGLIEPRFIG